MYLYKKSVFVVFAKQEDGKYMVQVFENLKDMFDKPFSSSLLGIYRIVNHVYKYRTVDKAQLKNKGFLVKWAGETFFCELLHNELDD